MDYTRMTQNGRWSGWLSVDGERIAIGTDWTGTRDRSWGIRPVGTSDPQPPPEGNFNQFFWLWTPCNFRSEEHTSELQSLMRISYAVFCFKKKTSTSYPAP